MTVLSNIITPSNVLTTTNTATVTNKTFGDNPTFSAGTANGVTFLNGSKVLTSGSALTFDGTNLNLNSATPPIVRLQSATTSSAMGLDFYYTDAGNSKGGLVANFGAGEVRLSAGASGNTYFQSFYTNGSEGMRLTSTGLGIGTSSPSTKLAVAGGISGTGAINISGGGWGVLPYVANSLVIDNNGGETRFFATGANATTDGSFLFYTSQTDGGANERARIDSSGNLLVGTTSQLINNARLSAQGVYTSDSNTTTYSTQRAAAVLHQDGGSGSNNQGSYCALVLSTNVGAAINPGVLMRGYGGSSGTTYNIQINENGNITNANNSYGSLSDESLKENIVDATPKLKDLMAVQVRGYNLKNDEKKTKQLGVIAQELETVFPSMVEVEPDGLKSVKYSIFVPMLIKALQEQQALITQLQADVTTLKGN